MLRAEAFVGGVLHTRVANFVGGDRDQIGREAVPLPEAGLPEGP